MKTTAILLITFATLTPVRAQSPDTSPGKIGEAKTPVAGARPDIVMDRASADIFPESWLTPRIHANADALPEAERPQCREVVDRALGKYAPALVGANLKKVHVLARLEYSGVGTGGTNSRSAVYVVSNSKYSPARLEGNFHAEFSSILFRNFPQHFDKTAWQQNNPPDFTYRGSGVQAIRSKQASLQLGDALHGEGFLHEYGKASIEEDFNSYAGRLFTGDAGLWRAIDLYPRVKAKAGLVIAFYGKLDATLTGEKFLSFRQPEKK